MSTLHNKLDQVKDEHADEVLSSLQSSTDQRSRDEAVFILGRIKQNDHLSQAIATNLDAQTIRALERFQQEKRFEALGYETFKQFLDESPMSPMTNRVYYDRLQLVRGHGDEIYDLLTASGISVRSFKLLSPGELAIKGDRLVVGDQEIDVTSGVIKDVLNDLFDEKRQLQSDLAKEKAKVEKQAATIKAGQDELNQLERNLDAMRGSDPYEHSLTRCISSLLTLTEQVGKLPDKRKAEAGDTALPLLWSAIRQVRKSYGTPFDFNESAPVNETDLDALAAEAFAGEDDEEDENDV